ncbi:hypothetical protein COBT_001206 [Conglomerata obtusa]
MWLFYLRLICGSQLLDLSAIFADCESVSDTLFDDSYDNCINDNGLNLSPHTSGIDIAQLKFKKLLEIAYLNHDYSVSANKMLNRYCGIFFNKDIMIESFKHDAKVLEKYYDKYAIITGNLTNNNEENESIKNPKEEYPKFVYTYLYFYLTILKRLPVTEVNASSLETYIEAFKNYLEKQIHFISSSFYLDRFYIESLNENFQTNLKSIPKYMYYSPRMLGVFICFHDIFTDEIPINIQNQYLAMISNINKRIDFALAFEPRKNLLNEIILSINIESLYEENLLIDKKYNKFFSDKNYFVIAESLFSDLLLNTNYSEIHLSLFKILARYCPLDNYKESIKETILYRQIHYVLNLSFVFLNEQNIPIYFHKNNPETNIYDQLMLIGADLEFQKKRYEFVTSLSFIDFFLKCVSDKIICVLEHLVVNKKHKLMLKLLKAIIPNCYATSFWIEDSELNEFASDISVKLMYNLSKRTSEFSELQYFNLLINVIFEVLIGLFHNSDKHDKISNN